MTLLQLVQRHCRRTGITVPSAVVTSTEDQIQMCLELLNEELDELSQRHKWQILQTEATWTSLAGADQGELRILAPGIIHDWVIQDTFYDRSGNLKFVGPLTDVQYARELAQATTGDTHTWRVRNGHMLLDSSFPAGSTLAFEYICNKAVVDAGGATKQYFSLDDDAPLLDDVTILAGLRWRWKREQGLAYDEDFRRYEGMVANSAGRNGGKPVLDAGGVSHLSAGVVIPIGNWPL